MNRERAAAIVVLAAVVALAAYVRLHGPQRAALPTAGKLTCGQARTAFSSQHSGAWLSVGGRVSRLLPNDVGRYTHQRFVLACRSGLTLLVVNDIDIGESVPVRRGNFVEVRGQYIWNEQGGLIHFTHHDPSGQSPGGWIILSGREYSLFGSDRPFRAAGNQEIGLDPAPLQLA